MDPRKPAAVGASVDTVETPALIVDLDMFEQNLAKMQAAADATGMRLRPHGKAHKTPEIARRQMGLGAVGICCQKLAEAEVFADAGIPDILISNQIADPAKLARLPALAKKVKLGICVDDPLHVERLAQAFDGSDERIDVYVELDVGMGRCGVPAGDRLVALAQAITAAPGLTFAGVQAYQGGAQHMRTHAERAASVAQAVDVVRAGRALLAEAGLDLPLVTGAGTGTYPLESASGEYGELQAGSYALMDADYARNTPGPEGAFAPALTLLTTVISTAVAGRAVVDVGLKGVTVEFGLPVPVDPDITARGVADEHCILVIPEGSPIRPGDRLSLVPGHIDPVCNLHDWIVGVRDGVVEELWRVEARGPGL